MYLTIITFFSIKNIKYKKYDFILSGVEDQRSLDRYRSLLDRFKNPLVISKKYSLKDKKIEFYKDSLFFFTLFKSCKGKKINLIAFSFKVIFLSLKYKFNYLHFYNLILFSILRNHNVFEKKKKGQVLYGR